LTEDNSKSLSKQRFGKYAQSYITSKPHSEGADLDSFIEIARPQPDWIVLDVATGGGHTALKFAPYVGQVTATDITPNMLEAARKFITGKGMENVEFELADAEDLPFEDDRFDLVTCRIAPHHFTDCAGFVQECARVLKQGGLLLVQDHVLPDDESAAQYMEVFEKLRDPSHNRAYTESEWREMFQAAGLTVTHAEQITKKLQFTSWVERQDCAPEVVQRLIMMMKQASGTIAEWMQARDIGTPDATFLSHHIIMAGRKD
jgi:ubiquinone/menaquinone biosynthesis C-methylase UbiE